MDSKVLLARKYCEHYHQGQVRKGSNLAYSTHPIEVSAILLKYGYDDEITQCIALLHDTVEDSELRMDEIQKIFGYEIANGVYILSRNKGKMRNGEKLSRGDYLQRIFWARNKIKRVKIADMIHNTRDLESLSPSSIKEKVKEMKEFYIPLGKKIAPIMVKELILNLRNFESKSHK